MNSFSRQEACSGAEDSTAAVLSATGTESSWTAILGMSLRVVARWHRTVVRLPPADEPLRAMREVSRLSLEAPAEVAQRRDSQQSSTAAGNGSSGASLGMVLVTIHFERLGGLTGSPRRS